MNRSKVVVHMYVSIDGKIDGPYGSGVSSSYYADQLFWLSNADANGRKTIQKYAAPRYPDLTPFATQNIEYTDWLPDIKAKMWSVAFDRRGQCGWTQNYFAYNGQKMHAIEIVTKQAQPAYLAFLQSMQIPYIIGGTEEFDFTMVLTKLKRHFRINTLAVCGGATINGAFLRAHLVDEISLVVAPHVNGDAHQQASFNTGGHYIDDTFAFASAQKLADGGVQLIFNKMTHH